MPNLPDHTTPTPPPEGGSKPPARRAQAAEQARARILDAAREHFQQYGFDRASLAEIGSAAGGLTRGAVLYHYGSKVNLLGALLEPFTAGLQRHLDEMETTTPPPRPAAVIDVLLDLLTHTRAAADLLAHDIAARHALDLDTWSTASARRLARLLAPTSTTDPTAEARAYAALGALIRPLVYLPDPITDPVRQAIRQAALDALGQTHANYHQGPSRSPTEGESTPR